MRGRHQPRVRAALIAARAQAAADAPVPAERPAGKSPRRKPDATDRPGRRAPVDAPQPRPGKPRTRDAGAPAAPHDRGAAKPAARGDTRPPGDGAGGQPPRRQTSARATVAQRRPRTWSYFASCPRGLEQELARELAGLGAADITPASGGVAFGGDVVLGWKVNLWSRLAIRVLLRVAEGRYQREEDLYQAALAVDWPAWFAVERTLAVTTVGRNSPLKSLNFVSLRVKDAVCDRFRQVMDARPSVDTRHPDVPLTLFLSSDRYTLYIDLSGEPLNRRGYRVAPSPAPLNENLAAGMLLLSGWTPDTPLYDPMMGGGTLLLEAALMALKRAPGLHRHFAFEHLRDFDRVAWARLRKDAEAVALKARPLPIFGSDIDPAMVRAAGLNLRAAGLLDCVRLMQADFLNVDPPAPEGIIVSNPPYGVRMGARGDAGERAGRRRGAATEAEAPRTAVEASVADTDLPAFYRALGDNLKQHFPGWTAWLLSADPELPKRIGLQAARRIPLFNGPLECRLLQYRVIAGSHRRVVD